MPTMTDKQRYYLKKECIDNYHKLWKSMNKDEINAKRRARYAARQKEGLRMAIASELEIDSLKL